MKLVLVLEFWHFLRPLMIAFLCAAINQPEQIALWTWIPTWVWSFILFYNFLLCNGDFNMTNLPKVLIGNSKYLHGT